MSQRLRTNRAAPLSDTGSIVAGLSLSALLERLAERYAVDIEGSTSAIWRGTTHMINHIDNWLDGDYPDGGESEQGHSDTSELQAYVDYLRNSRPPPSSALATSPTGAQIAAFKDLVRLLDAEGVSQSARNAFATNVGEWIEASTRAKTSTSVSELVRARREEGHSLAALYTGVVPDSCRSLRFPAFVRCVEKLWAGAQVLDMVVDAENDVGRIALDTRRITVKTALVVAALRDGLHVAIRAPSLLPVLARKLRVQMSNRTGELNAERTYS